MIGKGREKVTAQTVSGSCDGCPFLCCLGKVQFFGLHQFFIFCYFRPQMASINERCRED